MERRQTHKLREATGIEIGFFELRAHRNISTPAVVTTKTGNVMRDDHTIAHLKLERVLSRLDHPPGQLVT
jgi:hypothetical protein